MTTLEQDIGCEVDSDEAAVRENVRNYCQRYSISPEFPISDVTKINESWPFGDSPGCYLFYDENMGLLYIGKASNKNVIAGRVYSYFRTQGLDQLEPRHAWLRPPRYIQTIKVHKAYEAPSLEEFLIRRLKPITNVIRGEDVATSSDEQMFGAE